MISFINASVKYRQVDNDGGTNDQGIFSNGQSGNGGHQIEFQITDWQNGSPQFLMSWSDASNQGSPNMEHAWLDFQNVIFNEWYNITISLSNNTLKWYLNNQLVQSPQE